MTLEMMIHNELARLSSGQRKVAEYILQNTERFSYATLSRLSKEISVSETTIIRLAYSLGFNGFSEMQQKVRHDILGGAQKPVPDAAAAGGFYHTVFAKEAAALNEWISQVDEGQLNQIVEMILCAEQILVVGARFSYPAANWFGDHLNLLLGNTFTVQEFYDRQFHLLNRVDSKSVVFCISFARYTRWTLNFAEAAKQQGAKVVSFTDRLISPLCSISDLTVLAAPLQDSTGSTSPICLYCLFAAIIARIREEKRDSIIERLQNFEKTCKSFDLFDE